MSIDVRAVAIRFADLWAVDPHQMVDEIYAADIVMQNMADPTRFIINAGQLHSIEDRLAALIPEHRHELVRVLVDGRTACLETTVVAPITHEYAPACVWWWVDGSAKVAAEVGWFDWELRSPSSRTAHGTVPPIGALAAGADAAFWRQRADEYARAWTIDPLGAGMELFGAACTSGQVGRAESCGVAELERDRRAELDHLPLGVRSMDVHRVLGEGRAMAMLVVIGDGERATRGTIVLTYGSEGDSDGLVVSERRYLDWSKAMPRAEFGAGELVGSPGWSPRDG